MYYHIDTLSYIFEIDNVVLKPGLMKNRNIRKILGCIFLDVMVQLIEIFKLRRLL